MREFSEPGRPAYRILTRKHYRAMRACKCGGEYTIVATRSGDVAGEVFDVHDGECPECGRRIRYVIDVGFYVTRLGNLLQGLHGKAHPADA